MTLRNLLSLTLFTVLFSTPLLAAEAFKVTSTLIEDRKAVLATVQTVDMTPARARIGGTLVELLVDEGSKVEAGEVIARVKDEKLHLEMQAVQARTASLQAERKLAQIALDRAEKLRKTGAGSQAKLDEARTNLDVVVKNLKAMGSEKDLVLQREREGAVLSPTNGRVIRVNTTNGAVVMPGEAIANIADSTYILRIEVPERHARFIKVGDEVEVGNRGMSTLEDTSYKGIVRQVYPEMQRGRVVADVSVDHVGDYFIGERIKVYVATGQRETILIPCDRIFLKYGLNYVLLADGNEVVVQPASAHADQCEILSGLRIGDEILMPMTAQ